MTKYFLLLVLLAGPAFAEEPTLLPPRETISVPEARPTTEPTPVPPMCSEVNPSLTRCLAVQDPAAVLNQRVTNLEQRDQQIVAAIQELQQKVMSTPKAKK